MAKRILAAKAVAKDMQSHGGHQVIPLLNVPEAAKILGVSVWTLRQWLSQRRLAIVKVGRLTKLRLEDIQDFINRHRREAIDLDGDRNGQR
jgi:excisionase family DNA binding protein